ncbi:hypothetical protein ACQJBY_017085 [Aegilops geniculata]
MRRETSPERPISPTLTSAIASSPLLSLFRLLPLNRNLNPSHHHPPSTAPPRTHLPSGSGAGRPMRAGGGAPLSSPPLLPSSAPLHFSPPLPPRPFRRRRLAGKGRRRSRRGLAADGGLAGVAAAGRAAAACGASTKLAVTPMEGKGPAGACRWEKLGGLVDWGDGGHQVSSIDLDRATTAHARGGGERPSAAAHVDRFQIRRGSSRSGCCREGSKGTHHIELLPRWLPAEEERSKMDPSSWQRGRHN